MRDEQGGRCWSFQNISTWSRKSLTFDNSVSEKGRNVEVATSRYVVYVFPSFKPHATCQLLATTIPTIQSWLAYRFRLLVIRIVAVGLSLIRRMFGVKGVVSDWTMSCGAEIDREFVSPMNERFQWSTTATGSRLVTNETWT